MTTQLIDNVDLGILIEYDESPADPNHRTHIVNPPMNTHIWEPGMEAQDIVDVARANGVEVVALCGYRFVPKFNPERFDACEACMKTAENIMQEVGE